MWTLGETGEALYTFSLSGDAEVSHMRCMMTMQTQGTQSSGKSF